MAKPKRPGTQKNKMIVNGQTINLSANSTTANSIAQQNQAQAVVPPTPTQVQRGNILPTGGIAFDEFSQMDDDDKADVISKALQTQVPIFLDNSDLQKFTYFTGFSNKPTLVDDATFQKMSGKALYRSVNSAYNKSKDIGYTANDILEQIADGDFTMYSDSGGSAYGKAIYATNSYTGSSYYGGSMMAMKITQPNRFIGYHKLSNMFRNEIHSGSKLGKALAKVNDGSALGLYALAKGYAGTYDEHSTSDSYHMIYDRSALAVSKTFKNARSASSWKNATATKTMN